MDKEIIKRGTVPQPPVDEDKNISLKIEYIYPKGDHSKVRKLNQEGQYWDEDMERIIRRIEQFPYTVTEKGSDSVGWIKTGNKLPRS